AHAERIFLGEYLGDVSGRLGGVQDEGSRQCTPADVGERFPALGFDLALVATDARRAREGAHGGRAQLDLPRQCRRALRTPGKLAASVLLCAGFARRYGASRDTEKSRSIQGWSRNCKGFGAPWARPSNPGSRLQHRRMWTSVSR